MCVATCEARRQHWWWCVCGCEMWIAMLTRQIIVDFLAFLCVSRSPIVVYVTEFIHWSTNASSNFLCFLSMCVFPRQRFGDPQSDTHAHNIILNLAKAHHRNRAILFIKRFFFSLVDVCAPLLTWMFYICSVDVYARTAYFLVVVAVVSRSLPFFHRVNNTYQLILNGTSDKKPTTATSETQTRA